MFGIDNDLIMTADKCVYQLIVAAPLVIPFSGIPIVPIGVGHLTVGRLYFSFVFAAFFLYACSRRRCVRLEPIQAVSVVILMAYGVLLAISSFWAISLARALTYTVFYWWFAAFIAVALASGADRLTLSRSVDLWSWSALVVGVMCYFELFHGIRFPGSRYYLDENPYFFHPTAVFHNENDLAIYLAISSVFVVNRALRASVAGKCLWAAALVWFFVVIVETSSQGGMLVYILGLFGYIASHLVQKARRATKLFATSLAIILSILAVQYYDFYQASLEGLWRVSNPGSARIALLQNASDASAHNYGLGVGAGNAETFMEGRSNVRVLNVHNWMGEVLANTGVLGASLWLLLLGVILAGITRAVRRDRGAAEWQRALIIVYLLFPLWQSVVSSMNQFMPFWVLLLYSLMSTADPKGKRLVGSRHDLERVGSRGSRSTCAYGDSVPKRSGCGGY